MRKVSPAPCLHHQQLALGDEITVYLTIGRYAVELTWLNGSGDELWLYTIGPKSSAPSCTLPIPHCLWLPTSPHPDP